MFSITQQQEQTLLLRTCEYDETREVTMAIGRDGELVVTERSDGEQTMLVFGTFAHARRVTIPAGAVEKAVRSLGLQGSDGSQALRAFFACRDVFLSDLQDALDRTGVVYGFCSWSGSEAAFRAAVL